MEPDAPISGRSPRVQTFACRAAPVGLGSLQSFAALYANVRIWSVVFYKKLVIIPRLTTREGQPDGGYLGVITPALMAASPHPRSPASAHH